MYNCGDCKSKKKVFQQIKTDEEYYFAILIKRIKAEDLDRVDTYGYTTLNSAALYNCESILVPLLTDDADIDKENNFDDTPLHSAAFNGRTYIAKKLLQYNAATYLKDRNNETACDTAVRRGYTETAQLLNRYMQDEEKTDD